MDVINNFNAELQINNDKFIKLVRHFFMYCISVLLFYYLQVNLLSLLGGDTLQKVVYLQMNKLLTNEVATRYSGQGKKKKLPFMTLKMYDAIIGMRLLNNVPYILFILFICLQSLAEKHCHELQNMILK